MYNRKIYKLPKEVYMKTLWHIRDYPRLKEECEALFAGAPVMDGQPKGSTPGDPTGQAAIKYAELSDGIRAVDNALKEIPQEYQSGVVNNIMYRIPYPEYAHPYTWSVYRQRFVFWVAKNMNYY